jgi:hypothetical protein
MYDREYYHKNKEWICARANRKYAETNGATKKKYYSERRDEILAKRRKKQLIRYWENKRTVLDYYGNACACCGESNKGFLTLDHINGGGSEERKRNGELWTYLVKNNFPDGYQILCYNCNCGRQQNSGVCPHVTNDRTEKTK